MATIYAIKNKDQSGEQFVQFVTEGEEVERMLYVPTNVAGQYLACDEIGGTYGYRHSRIETAIAAFAEVHGWGAVVTVSATHPSVRGMLTEEYIQAPDDLDEEGSRFVSGVRN